jgi:hypothetical protein
MTRKDYIAIAAALHRAYREAGMHPGTDKMNGVLLAAHELSATLKADNPRFDLDKFLDACVGVR